MSSNSVAESVESLHVELARRAYTPDCLNLQLSSALPTRTLGPNWQRPRLGLQRDHRAIPPSSDRKPITLIERPDDKPVKVRATWESRLEKPSGDTLIAGDSWHLETTPELLQRHWWKEPAEVRSRARGHSWTEPCRHAAAFPISSAVQREQSPNAGWC